MILARFVQISDLHVGELDPSTDDATLDAHTEQWLQWFPWFDGYLGHGGDALRHLDSFFSSRTSAPRPGLIVTGDLSTVGAPHELTLAHSFLTGFGTLPTGSKLGLNVPDVFERSVLGNHDHWSGRRAQHPLDPVMFGSSKAASSLPSTGHPILSKPWKLKAGLQLQFIRLNSDADVPSYSLHRLFARGRFDSELAPAIKALGVPRRDEIRVLLMHHSPSHQGLRLGISKRMRTALDSFIANVGVRVVLSGHTHSPGGEVRLIQGVPVLEARCGTTTQRDTVPDSWTRRKKKPVNTLLVHTLQEQPSGSITWKVETYVRTSLGFKPLPSVKWRGSFGPPEVEVWK